MSASGKVLSIGSQPAAFPGTTDIIQYPINFEVFASHLKRAAEVLGVMAAFAIPTYALRIVFVSRGDLSVAFALISDSTLTGLGLSIVVYFLPALAISAAIYSLQEVGQALGRRMLPDTRFLILLSHSAQWLDH
jgi:hypothetical protein